LRKGISPEAIALFQRLDRVPESRRDRREYQDGVHQLMRLLGLTDQYWHMQSPLDRSREPHHPPWCVAFESWHTCRAWRAELLAEIEDARCRG
jgi:hypothetical protein